MILRLTRTCGPRTTYHTLLEVSAKNSLELVEKLARHNLTVFFFDESDTTFPPEFAGSFPRAQNVDEAIEHLRPNGR